MARPISQTIQPATKNWAQRTFNINIDCPAGGDVFVSASRERVIMDGQDVTERDRVVPPVFKKLSDSPNDLTVTFQGITANAAQIAALCALMVDTWEELQENNPQ